MEVRVAGALVAEGGLAGEARRAEALADPALGRPHHRGAVAVAHGPAHDQRRIPVGRVVPEERVVPALRRAVGLQVRRGRRDRVDRVADVGVVDVRELRGVGEGRGQELHRALRARVVRRTAVAVAPVVGLDPPDRREHLPVELEACRRVLVEGEVRGRDPGEVRGAARRRGRLHGPDPREPRGAGEGDREHERRREAEAAAAEPPRGRAAHRAAARARSASAASRSAGRDVSIAYSRRETTASKATWLRPTKRSPSPGRAWTSERRSAGVRSK